MNKLVSRRVRSYALIAALAGVLAGCVIVPAHPYYYHPHAYWR